MGNNVRILVLGATGFIGSKLSERLILDGFEVVQSSSKDCNLTNYSQVLKKLKVVKPDVIFNLAAFVGNVHFGISHSGDISTDNLVMVINLYKAIKERGVKPIVISTIANSSYPSDADVQSEDKWWDGMPDESALAYASSRRMQFVIAQSYYDQYKIDTRHIILPGVYGPGDHLDEKRVHALDGIIMRMIETIRNNEEEFEVWGTGKPIREWIYIDDVVNLLVETMNKKNINMIYPINLAQKKGYSVKEIAEMISESLGFEGRIVFNEGYPDGSAIKVLDNKKFKETYGDYSFKSIIEGIRESARYYNGNIMQ